MFFPISFIFKNNLFRHFLHFKSEVEIWCSVFCGDLRQSDLRHPSTTRSLGATPPPKKEKKTIITWGNFQNYRSTSLRTDNNPKAEQTATYHFLAPINYGK
jgi:hypothetical protein